MIRLKIRQIRYELLFLLRYGFIYAYLFVILIYSAVLLALPEGAFRETAGISLVYSDISMLGLIFSGAVFHLERQSGTISAMAVMPVSPYRVTGIKALSMGGTSALFGMILMVIATGFKTDIILFLPGAIGCAFTFTLFGISLMTRTANLSRYIILAGVLTLPAGLPILIYLGFYSTPIYYLLPGAGGLYFISAAAAGLDLTHWWRPVFSAVNIIVWTAAAFLLAAGDYEQRLLRPGSGKKALKGQE